MYSRAPLVLVHYSWTATYYGAPMSCTTHTHAPISCTTPTHAQFVLVHHSVLVHCSVISCTTSAPLCTLVHPSRARAAISCTSPTHAPFSCTTPTRAPLVLVYHSALVHRSILSCTTHASLRTLVYHSCSCTTRAPLRNLVHHSRAPLKYSRALPSCTTLMHHVVTHSLHYSRTLVHHSITHNSHC